MRNLQAVSVRTSSGFEKICPFPVGYIYMSSDSTSPASLYGGTWSVLSDSRFFLPQNSWNSQGGESTHTLTINEIPSHNHSETGASDSISKSGTVVQIGFRGTDYTRTATGTPTGYTGGGAAHNNLPPYRTCYCWYRTA